MPWTPLSVLSLNSLGTTRFLWLFYQHTASPTLDASTALCILNPTHFYDFGFLIVFSNILLNSFFMCLH